MMTPYMSSGLSIPTENLRFSLPICLFSINILVCRIDSKSVADVLENDRAQDLNLTPVREATVGSR